MCIVVYYYMCTVLLTVDKGKRKGLQSRQGRLLLIFLFDGPCCWQMRQMYDTKTISVFDYRFVLAFSTKHIDVCLQTESVSLCVCEISYEQTNSHDWRRPQKNLGVETENSTYALVILGLRISLLVSHQYTQYISF